MSRRPIKPAINPDQQQQLHIVSANSAQDDKQDLGVGGPGVDDDDLLSPATPTAINKNKRKAQNQSGAASQASVAAPAPSTPAKRPRTNTPWTATEEQRLKNMRDAGNSWSENAKTFPTRTEGSVKKHWYKVSRTFHSQ